MWYVKSAVVVAQFTELLIHFMDITSFCSKRSTGKRRDTVVIPVDRIELLN